MSFLERNFFAFAKKNVDKFFEKWEDFTKKAIKVDDVSKKEIEVTNFPESIEVHGKVETDFKPPKDRFSEYSSLIKNLQENIQRNIVEYRVIAPILEDIRDKDTKPVVNLSNDFGKVEKYLSEIDEKVAKLSDSPIEFEKLKGTDPKSYVPVRLSDGEDFYRLMSTMTATVDPLSGYKISDVDDGNLDTNYYGYIRYDSNWYIMKEDVVNKTYRYTFGASSYPTSWANREALTYDYFNTMPI